MAKDLIIEPNTRWTMEYEDSGGTLTRREVTFKNFEEENGKLYANAYCHSRKGPRSFRADRIKSFISEDGEVLDISSIAPVLNGTKTPDISFRKKAIRAAYFAAAIIALTKITSAHPIAYTGFTFGLLALPIMIVQNILEGIDKRK
nr:WYL domain-containing protein [Amylibacter sp.]